MENPQRLIELYLTGRLRPDEVEALQEWLKSDPAHLRDFVIETYLNRGIHEILVSERTQAQECNPSDLDDMFHDIAEKQRTNDSLSGEKEDLQVPSEESENTTLHTLLEYATSPKERARVIESYAKRQLDLFLAEHQESGNQPPQRRERCPGHLLPDLRKVGAATERLLHTSYRMMVAVSILIVLGLVAVGTVHYVKGRINYFLAQRVVATLGDSRYARWAVPLGHSSDLRCGPLRLEEGWAQIKFLGGAEVVLQAPCSLNLESSRSMSLKSGSLTAKITSPQGRGFSVDTPNSQVVDFGTEFGVLVEEAGGSEVHIFDGRVRLEAANASGAKGLGRELTEGRRGRVDEKGRITTGDLDKRLFYRAVPDVNSLGIPGKRLDLADIFGGGNGFGTGQMECLINPLTGRYSTFDRDKYVKRGRGQYARVEQNDYVDGVFVPNDDGVRSVIVSSQGDVFQGCPKTNGDANGEVQNTHREILFHSGEMSCPPELDGRVFDTSAHPHIYLQANVGITFDLRAIRNRLTGHHLQRFTALCGVCAGIPRDSEEIDFWVLVDGQPRFCHRDTTKADGAVAISVPLYEQDRFLSLVTTEGTDGSGWDLGLFAEPVLELGAEETQ